MSDASQQSLADATSPHEQLPLFVYGTLRPGEANFHHYLQHRTSKIQAARVRGRLYWIPRGNYPYLTEGEDQVFGEVVWVKPEVWTSVLKAIDRLEEYDPDDEASSWYLRRIVVTRLTDNSTLRCWTYLWNRPRQGTLIMSGDWKKRELDSRE